MSRKIPIHELADILAESCSISKESAETFIRSFFELVAEGVTAGEIVKVKGIGTFSATDNAENPIDFSPDKTLSDTINAPFLMFEPEPLSTSVTSEMLAEIDRMEEESKDNETGEADVRMEEVTSVSTPESEAVSEDEDEDVTESIPETMAETIIETVPESISETTTATIPEPVVEAVPEPVIKPQVIPAPEPVKTTRQTLNPPVFLEEDPEEKVEDEEDSQSGGLGFGWGFVIGLISGIALGACGVYLAINYLFPMPETDKVEQQMEETAVVIEPDMLVVSDTVSPVITADTLTTTVIEEKKEPQAEAAPAPQEVVKDKIRAGYLIHEMAKKHYGSKAFWVYIYEENKAKIGNPNRLQAGLELIVPPAEKYGINANDPASIKAANEKAGKILAKYPN